MNFCPLLDNFEKELSRGRQTGTAALGDLSQVIRELLFRNMPNRCSLSTLNIRCFVCFVFSDL
jgi:hypothetical protein